MHSYLSRYSAARGSSTGLSILGLTKVKACKSFLFTIITRHWPNTRAPIGGQIVAK